MTTIVGCAISDELAEEARQVILDLRAGSHVGDEHLAHVIYRMTEESLHAQFLEPTKALGASDRTIRLISWSINVSLGATRKGLNKMIPKLNPDQMKQVADVIENSLHEEANLRPPTLETGPIEL